MINQYVNVDQLSLAMLLLVCVIGLVVSAYSRSFMRVDRYYTVFGLKLVSLIATTSVMLITNNALVLVIAWSCSNALLVSLMAHKRHWEAAQASVVLANRTLMFGTFMLATAMMCLMYSTGSIQINHMISQASSINSYMALLIGFCLVVTAMLQAGLWPFHKWLISSLNSPTPVSAIMHAGLVNGGGYILLRFLPLYSHQASVLAIMFVMGSISALLGTAFKLIQSDVKRQLACSTMGQMGFMTMLIGLGLYAVALTHIIWHALFKANLFLGSNSTITENKYSSFYPDTLMKWGVCLAISVVGLVLFYVGMHEYFSVDGRVIFDAILFCVLFQLTVIVSSKNDTPKTLLFGLMLIGAWLYGLYISKTEHWLALSIGMHPVALTWLHWVVMAVLFTSWIMLMVAQSLRSVTWFSNFRNLLYVKLLNHSQPHPETVTGSRRSYQF